LPENLILFSDGADHYREIRDQLKHLARMTGGTVLFRDNQPDCSKAARQILERARFEYRIGLLQFGAICGSE
jgi:hypothetical protein